MGKPDPLGWLHPSYHVGTQPSRGSRRDVLLSHQARDSQSAQLDVHGQRISQLQTELQESQLELQRGHSRREQQQRDLQTQTQQAEELHTQLAEVKGRLVQVEGENEALMGYKREQGAEVERLAVVVCSLQSSARDREGTESAQAEWRCVDLEGELTETRAQLTECQDRLQEARRRVQQCCYR
nr:leucine zipper putative tumor suppressor 1-like [Salvelinus alpinus]